MIKRLLASAAVVSVPSNCAQIEASSASNGLRACLLTVYDSPVAAPLRSHIPYEPTTATLEQLTDTNRPTPDEIALIEALYPEYAECYRAFISRMAGVAPGIAAIFEAAEQDKETQVVALVQGQLSWGDFVTRIKYEFAAMRVQLAGEMGRIQAANGAQQQAAFNNLLELTQMMQARTNSLNQAIRQQPLPPRPVYCSATGATFSPYQTLYCQ